MTSKEEALQTALTEIPEQPPKADDYGSYNKQTGELELSKAGVKAYALALLAWRIRSVATSWRMQIITANTTTGAAEKVLAWNGSHERWTLQEMDWKANSVVKTIVDTWQEDCGRDLHLRGYDLNMANYNAAMRQAREYLVNRYSGGKGVLADFDRLDRNAGAFRMGGKVYGPVPADDGIGYELDQIKSTPEHKLLVDCTGPVADDKEYQRELPDFIEFLSNLLPKYSEENAQKEFEDHPKSRHGNHAVDAIQIAFGKCFVRCKKRELTIFYGPGRNGKSHALEAFLRALRCADIHASIAVEVPGLVFADVQRDGSAFNKQKGGRALLAGGARVAICTEGNARRIDMDFLKAFTTGEIFVIGGNAKADEYAKAECGSFMASNRPAYVSEDTAGAEERLNAFHFTRDYRPGGLDYANREDDEVLYAKFDRWAPTIRRFCLEGGRIITEEFGGTPPLPAPVVLAEREAMLDRGRNPIRSALASFFVRVPKGGRTLLLGSADTAKGFYYDKKRYTGLMLVVRLVCAANGLKFSNYDKRRIENLAEDALGWKRASGNRHGYTGLLPTPALLAFLDEQTEGDQRGAIDYLFRDSQAKAKAPTTAKQPRLGKE